MMVYLHGSRVRKRIEVQCDLIKIFENKSIIWLVLIYIDSSSGPFSGLSRGSVNQSYLINSFFNFFFKKIILNFRDFHDFQHTFINNKNLNNFLTNNSISNCFSASFTSSSLKVECRCYAWAKKEQLSLRIDLAAQGIPYRCSKVECEDHSAIQAPLPWE